MKRLIITLLLLCPTLVSAIDPIQVAIDKQSTSRPAYLDLKDYANAEGFIALTAPLNLKDRPSGVIIDGCGKMLSYSAGGRVPAVNMVGSAHCVLRDLTIICGNPDNRASCGILVGRKDQESAGLHSFTNVNVEPYFSVAPVVNVGSEGNVWLNCGFHAFGGGQDAAIMTTTAPTGLGAPVAPAGLLTQTFLSCYFFVDATTRPDAHCLRIQSTDPANFVIGDFLIAGSNFAVSAGPAGEGRGDAAILIDAPDVVMSRIKIDSCRFETALCKYCIRKTERTRPNNLIVDNCYLESWASSIYSPGTDWRVSGFFHSRFTNNTYVNTGEFQWSAPDGTRPIFDALVSNCTVDVSSQIYQAPLIVSGVQKSWPANTSVRLQNAWYSDVRITKPYSIPTATRVGGSLNGVPN